MNNQIIREIERIHYLMQLASYFSELTDLPGISYAYTKFVSDTWYNQAYNISIKEDDSLKQRFEELLRSSEGFFSARNRATCFYLTPASVPSQLGKLLEANDYMVFDEEAWMFLDPNKYVHGRTNDNIRIVEVREDTLPVFGDVYRRTLPGPEVNGYIDCVVNGFISKPPLVDIKYYLAYVEDIPIGMLSLLCLSRYAGLYAIAVDENYQKIGACRAMLTSAVEHCKKSNIEYMFLQTGHDTDSETIFKHMGFVTEFVRNGYAQKSIVDTMQHG